MASKVEFMLVFNVVPGRISCDNLPKLDSESDFAIVKSLVNLARDYVRQKLVGELSMKEGTVSLGITLRERKDGRDVHLKLLNAQGSANDETPSE
jgi:hypothetical protein